MKYRNRSIDRYSFDTLLILVFKSYADTEPILSITSGDTIGIDSDTDIYNPVKDNSRYSKIENSVLGIEMFTLKETPTPSLVFSIFEIIA
jgi:hypothetical protein